MPASTATGVFRGICGSERVPNTPRERTTFGGMDPTMTKRLQERQKENSRLEKLVALQAPDMLILDLPPVQCRHVIRLHQHLAARRHVPPTGP
jgi:hypothetical protein